MRLLSKILLSHLVVVALPIIAAFMIPYDMEPAWIRPAVVLGLTALALVGATMWGIKLNKRLQSLAELARKVSGGNLSSGIEQSHDASQADEISELGSYIEQMRLDLVQTLRMLQLTSQRSSQASASLTELAKKINVSAGEISSSMDEIANGAGLQTELVDQTSALIQEVARSIQRTARSAEDAARSSAEASTVAQSGSKMASQAADKLRGVFEQIERTAERVFQFSQRTKEIGAIVRVITEVAQQTHLLAINATIEAARAGEAGRGFAVVAEEIRQLAENTSRSTDKISKIVDEVGVTSYETVQEVWASTKQLSEGREQLESIVDALKNIASTVTSGSDRVQIISRLAKEQIAGAQQTVEAIVNISSVAQKNASATLGVRSTSTAQSESILQVSRLATELVEVSTTMDEEVGRFHLQEEENDTGKS